MHVESNTVVLLQTDQSLIGKVGSVVDQKHKTRIVFDSCSQRSYISNRLSYSCRRVVLVFSRDIKESRRLTELVWLSGSSGWSSRKGSLTSCFPLMFISSINLDSVVSEYPEFRDG